MGRGAQIEATGVPLSLPVALWSTAAAEQDKRREQDPWDDILANVEGTTIDGKERITTTELLKVHLGIPTDKCTDAIAKRLGHCMDRLGWEKLANPIRIAGTRGRGFQRPVKQEDAGRRETGAHNHGS